MFIDDLKKNGYQIDFANFHSATIKIKEYGEYLYDHIVILAT